MTSSSVYSLSTSIAARFTQFQGRSAVVSGTRRFPTIGSALLVGIGYYLGIWIGIALTPAWRPISTFWPPNAILLAAFLLLPRRSWWTCLVVVFPAHMLAQFQHGIPFWTAFGWFLTNCSEGIVGALFITWFVDLKTAMQSVRGVFVFITFGVLIAPFMTSFLDAGSVVITGWGKGYWSVGLERFWSNALAELTIVPIILGIAGGIKSIRHLTAARLGESALLAIGTGAVGFLAFGSKAVSPISTPALLYLPLPLLLWAAARFGIVGLSFSVLETALISIWFTVHGREPFPHTSVAQNIISLQVLLCTVVVPLMFLSATIAEGRRTRESLKDISKRLIQAQEEERHRIARELHDDLGQQLALANVHVQSLIPEVDVSVQPTLAELSDQLSAISDTARSISHGLYPSQLEYLGLVAAVNKLCTETGNTKDLSLELELGNVPRRVKPSVSLCIYRVLQETLHNVMRHSRAKKVRVELATANEEILLRVTDDGVGFDIAHHADGLGLKSIQQRVESEAGSIDIGSIPNGGTRIEVRIPLGRDDHRAA